MKEPPEPSREYQQRERVSAHPTLAERIARDIEAEPAEPVRAETTASGHWGGRGDASMGEW